MLLRNSFLEYIVFRLNVLTIIQNFDALNIQTTGFKITTAKGQSFYNCIGTEDMQRYKAFITKAQLDLSKTGEEINISLKLLEEIVIYWCTNIHLRALNFIRQVDEFLNSLKEAINWKTYNMKTNYKHHYNFDIFGVFHFYIKISERHLAKIALGNKIKFSIDQF